MHVQETAALNYYYMKLQSRQKVDSSTPKALRSSENPEAAESCSTFQSDPRTQYKKMKETLHNLFDLAKTELGNIYQSVLNQVTVVSAMFKSKQKVSEELIDELVLITKQAQRAMLQLPLRLFNILVVPDLIKNKLGPCIETQNKNKLEPGNTVQAKTKPQKRTVDKQGNSKCSVFQKLERKTTTRLHNISFEKPDEILSFEGEWPLLQQVVLQNKSISTLKFLANIKASKLKSVNLAANSISDLSCLKKVDLPELQILNLSSNKIKNLQGFSQAHLPKLRNLNLSYNLLTQIDSTFLCGLTELLEFNLQGNKLTNIEKLSKCQFPNLQILNLDKNKLSSLNILRQSSFYRLKVLSFSHNNIGSLQFLPNMLARRLQALVAHHNKIKSLQSLAAATLPTLKEIILHNNQVQNLCCVTQMLFPQLQVFDVQANKIKRTTVGCFVVNDKGCGSAKSRFPFILI